MDSKELKFLLFFLTLIAILGFGFSGLIACISVYKKGLLDLPICLDSDCVGYFLNEIESAVTLAGATMGVMVSVATVGGIVVALLSYLNSSNTSALSNHIAHFSIFHNYVGGEIEKLSMVSPGSVDILSLYNFIFHKSRSGKTDVAASYIDIVNDINAEITASNGKAEFSEDGSFRYKDHQNRIICVLKKLGIKMAYLPRNDFYEAEGQVFLLIERINQSFCYSDSVPNIVKRRYI